MCWAHNRSSKCVNRVTMSLQWTAVAGFLYAEVFALLLMCIPFISAKQWQRLFRSGLFTLAVSYGNKFFFFLIALLIFLMFDAIREVQKYSVPDRVDLKNLPTAEDHIHMKLFRAQRNLYIAGFALLLWFVLRRLVTLISQQATLLATNEAFKKQAESATEAAKKYMEENEGLQKALKEAGVELGAGGEARQLEQENQQLKADLGNLKEEVATVQRGCTIWEGAI
ncbi:LOW QUALITY PROTEIN: B-cell receptor-associated protein 31 [Pristis pectinata]|uniref:LOW QUALITY PROTEIN: B-cell receptor-associated protein 31 n=1 Tax=Pristis pectinata TaxID=685728 RepID=UPI00223C90E8|nr:LOW QUALITY PROTEIN: B-cell receptor-associated protein 31 [Pristis pectinata]